MAFAEAGFHVTGIDLSSERVAAIAAGRSYLVDVPAERYADVKGRLEATTDYSVVSSLDALTICVPTPLSKTHTPDLSYVVSAAQSVAESCRRGQSSTTAPGTPSVTLRVSTTKGYARNDSTSARRAGCTSAFTSVPSSR